MKIKLIPFFVLLLFAGCANTDPQQLKERLIGSNTEERIVPVGVMRVDSTTNILSNTYPGYLEEGQSVDLAFKYGGSLTQVNMREGSYVNKGQVLARVSSAALESSLRSAQATLTQAQDAYNRLQAVHDNGSLPEIRWAEMEANLERAQASYDLAAAMMNENVITAPFSGHVTSVKAEIGENLPPMKPVISLINTEKLSVKISVPEDEIAKVQVGNAAEVIIPALGNRSYHGTITEKSMTASLLTHSYPVKVLIEQPDEDLSPGMIGKVMLESDASTGIIVPANAILINNDGKFVWVVENGKATRRFIQIAGYSGTGVIVNDGLQNGDFVIVEGYQKVSEGMKVHGNEQRD